MFVTAGIEKSSESEFAVYWLRKLGIICRAQPLFLPCRRKVTWLPIVLSSLIRHSTSSWRGDSTCVVPKSDRLSRDSGLQFRRASGC